MIIIGCPLGPVTCLITGHGLIIVRFSSCGAGLTFRDWLVKSMTSVPPLHRYAEGIFHQASYYYGLQSSQLGMNDNYFLFSGTVHK